MRDVILFSITFVLLITLSLIGYNHYSSITANLVSEINILGDDFDDYKIQSEQKLSQQSNVINQQSQLIGNLQTEIDKKSKQLDQKISSEVTALSGSIETVRRTSDEQIGELKGQIKEVEIKSTELVEDLEKQIKDLDISPDFSSIISRVIQSVVSVRTDKGQGSGAIIRTNGYIITNEHVINSAAYITVKTFDGKQYSASIISSDAQNDVAVLKIEGSFNNLEFDNSDNVKVGEKVIAVGSPLGFEFTVTEGIISSLNRNINNVNYFQTDVPINPGNSGGPLVNKLGKIIGINTRKVAGGEGLGFALKSNHVKQIVDLFIGGN